MVPGTVKRAIAKGNNGTLREASIHIRFSNLNKDGQIGVPTLV